MGLRGETMNTFILDHETAEVIRLAFLPRNPKKMRKASPEVRAAVTNYLDALYASGLQQRAAAPKDPA